MKRKIIYSLITSLLLILNSCGGNPFESSVQSGRRDYVWTTDTIRISFGHLSRMWGSSPTDIWAVGQGGGSDQTIWHFDGVKWKTDGIPRNISPSSIYGFSKNDVWMGGYEGTIWHYNGSAWSENLRLTPIETWSPSSFACIYGASSNDLYATGSLDSTKIDQDTKGIMFHYDGSSWKRIYVDAKKAILGHMRKSSRESNYYLSGLTIEANFADSGKIYSFNGSKLKEIFHTVDNNTRGASVAMINDKIYFGLDSGVYTFDGSNFILQFSVADKLPKFTQGLAGRSDKDIFLAMWDGIAHYNGTDIQYIVQGANLRFSDILLFEKDVIMIALDLSSGATIIKRGRLN